MFPERREPDFDWTADSSVLLERRNGLAIYVNSRSEVVLRMQQDCNDNDDSFVYFPFNDAEMVAARIMQIVRNPADYGNAPRPCVLSEAQPAKVPAKVTTVETSVTTGETLLDRIGARS